MLILNISQSLSDTVTFEKWEERKSNRVPSHRVPLCQLMASRFSGVMIHDFHETQKRILLFGCDPVSDGRLLCIKYACSKDGERLKHIIRQHKNYFQVEAFSVAYFAFFFVRFFHPPCPFSSNCSELLLFCTYL